MTAIRQSCHRNWYIPTAPALVNFSCRYFLKIEPALNYIDRCCYATENISAFSFRFAEIQKAIKDCYSRH